MILDRKWFAKTTWMLVYDPTEWTRKLGEILSLLQVNFGEVSLWEIMKLTTILKRYRTKTREKITEKKLFMYISLSGFIIFYYIVCQRFQLLLLSPLLSSVALLSFIAPLASASSVEKIFSLSFLFFFAFLSILVNMIVFLHLRMYHRTREIWQTVKSVTYDDKTTKMFTQNDSFFKPIQFTSSCRENKEV